MVPQELHESYKQPQFHTMAHITKFITPGSTRVGLESSPPSKSSNLYFTAFETKEGTIVVVVLNRLVPLWLWFSIG